MNQKDIFAAALLGLSAVAMPLGAFATVPSLIWCDGCTNIQKQNVASTVRPINTVYVGDVTANTVQAFYLYRDSPNFAQSSTQSAAVATVVAEPIAGDPATLTMVSNMIAFYHAAPVGWKKHVVLYTDNASANTQYSNPAVNVYNVVNPGIAQNGLTSWAAGLTSGKINNVATTLFQVAAYVHIVDLSHDPQVSTTIEFEDGSHVDVVIDYSTTNPQTKVDPTTARDSHNNNVPYVDSNGVIHGLGGSFGFSGPGNPNDLQSFLNEMATFNVPIGSVSGNTHGWACTVSGEGANAVYSCRQY